MEYQSVHRLASCINFGKINDDRTGLLLLWEGHALPLCLHAAAACAATCAAAYAPACATAAREIYASTFASWCCWLWEGTYTFLPLSIDGSSLGASPFIVAIFNTLVMMENTPISPRPITIPPLSLILVENVQYPVLLL